MIFLNLKDLIITSKQQHHENNRIVHENGSSGYNIDELQH